jgi:hypothetical protein
MALFFTDFSRKGFEEMRWIVITAVGLLTSTSAYAQTPSGPAHGKSCSQLVAECVAYNIKGHYDVNRCYGYKEPCIATGTYQDRNRIITDVKRR